MQFLYIAILILFIDYTHSKIEKKILKNIIEPFHKKQINENEDNTPNARKSALQYYLKQKNHADDANIAKNKAKILQKARNHEHNINNINNVASSEHILNIEHGKDYYHMDPVLNQLRRNHQKKLDARRHVDSSSLSSSSSRELKDWKEEFNDDWLQKKFEAVHSTDMRGDAVNMLAARPSGVPCGDPNQHDIPWGTCMLPMQCDAEYRIYRGDNFCGNTQYICCSLQISTYDLNQGFDVSFAGSSFETDSNEVKDREKGSNEKKRKKNRQTKKKRHEARRKRKRQMKKKIRRIVHEIRKILNRSYRNSTQHRKKRTKLLKRYVKDLKKQYIKDRKSVREIHREDMINIDEALKIKLNHISDVNKNFVANATFRDIILHGSMTKQGARMLMEAYPELTSYMPSFRRAGDIAGNDDNNDHLDYDIEYGVLYY